MQPASLSALVADPSPFGAAFVRDILVEEGVGRVIVVQDGAEAVTALGEWPPDLVVVDWHLPVIAARDLVTMARAAPNSHAHAPAVIASLHEPTRSAVEAALALRVDAILAAPFSARLFRTRLRQIVGRVGRAPDASRAA